MTPGNVLMLTDLSTLPEPVGITDEQSGELAYIRGCAQQILDDSLIVVTLNRGARPLISKINALHADKHMHHQDGGQ